MKQIGITSLRRDLVNSFKNIIKELSINLSTNTYNETQTEKIEINSLVKENNYPDYSYSSNTTPNTLHFNNQNSEKYIILNGKKKYINYSNEILLETAEWLIQQNKINESNLPIKISKGNRKLIDKTKVHFDGKQFRAPKKLSNGWFIESNTSTSQIIQYSYRLLKKFGYNHSILEIHI